MPIPVSLQEFIIEMDVFSDESHAFLNRTTGELFTVTDEEMSLAESGDLQPGLLPWREESIEKVKEILTGEDWKSLPSKFDIHDYRIMENFCLSFEDDETRQNLLNAIRGSGAFRRFNAIIHEQNLADDWYEYRQRELEELAIQWLEANEIPYVRDTKDEEQD